MPDVRNVISRQGTDLSPLINGEAGDNAVVLTAMLIAESTLNEKAWRYTAWPDCSGGLSQVIAANLGYGTYSQPPSDARLAAYRAYMEQPANAIHEGWKMLGPIVARIGDPVWSLVAYNVSPHRSLAELQALATEGAHAGASALAVKTAHAMTHYAAAYNAAQAYAIPQEEPAMPADTEQPSVDEQIKQLSAQQALQTAALRRILEGKLEGADGAAGAVVALEGGQTSIEVGLLKEGA